MTAYLITASDPAEQECYWCAKPSVAAFLPNRKGAAIFNYVCDDHLGHADAMKWERRQPGVPGTARKSARK